MSLADPLPGRELAAFVTAVESGTVQGAADSLQLTQSAATKRIQALERRVGRPLLQRGPAGVQPTPDGLVLYPLAREALAVLARAEAALRSPHELQVLRLHASRTIGETLLPEWLAAFRATSPRCHVAATVTNSEQVIRAVRDGECDIGFVEGPPTRTRGLAELVVAHDEIVAVVAAGHPWARRSSVPVQALRSDSYFTREEGSGTRAVVTDALAAAGVELQPEMELASAESLKRAVLAGGFALISERTVATEITAGTLVAIPVADAQLHRSLRAVRRTRPALQGPARAFWNWLGRAVD
ncbi:LysR family transcriptional regulator [Solirubrobacter soli]|uniref:LysR family transcriptional regulator n=1 Tax=Solirubrobacter soli TaxID=363832 RepID=UPI00042123A5|nr:LysR family transcriptional regulator [Solirubrobacter soli]